ncbi:MAG: hypothetical protein CMF72_24630 [Mameliella sp.]|nr:hypothetical protein [Mameliella sp.]|tara:strand:- start:124 stop:426 length:303 start_codon:yes stop_codon:yes gene_type:complete
MSDNQQTEIVPDEVDVEVTVHWGCQLIFRDTGRVYLTRWNPGYGTGIYVPYSEAEARADVRRSEQFDKRLVTRTETVTTVTTPWREPTYLPDLPAGGEQS